MLHLVVFCFVCFKYFLAVCLCLLIASSLLLSQKCAIAIYFHRQDFISSVKEKIVSKEHFNNLIWSSNNPWVIILICFSILHDKQTKCLYFLMEGKGSMAVKCFTYKNWKNMACIYFNFPLIWYLTEPPCAAMEAAYFWGMFLLALQMQRLKFLPLILCNTAQSYS